MADEQRKQLCFELDQEAERAAARIRAIQPRPCKKFRNATIAEWVAKLYEETNEAVQEAVCFSWLVSTDDEENEEEIDAVEDRLALELTDVITVCTSWLDALGYSATARGELQRLVNEKNKKRGYF